MTYRFPAPPPVTSIPSVPKGPERQVMVEGLCALKEYGSEECFARDSKCSGKIIKAHSVQNAVILEQLCLDNHVYVIRPDAGGQLSFHLEGRNETLTYTGFCSYHDGALFSDIDFRTDGQFGPPSEEQSVLFHLRALGLECWTKAVRVKHLRTHLQRELATGRNAESLAIWVAIYNGLRVAHDRLRREVRSCVLQLRAKRFHPIIGRHYVFPGIIRLAAALVCSMILDVHGIPIVKLAGRVRPYPHVSLTIFPLGGDTHVLFGYHQTHRDHFKKFFAQFDGGSDEERQVWLTKLIFHAYENVVFSPKFIDTLDSRDRKLITAWIAHLYERDLPMPYIPNFNFFE